MKKEYVLELPDLIIEKAELEAKLKIAQHKINVIRKNDLLLNVPSNVLESKEVLEERCRLVKSENKKLRRMLVKLLKDKGHPKKEIQEILGISRTTVNSDLMRFVRLIDRYSNQEQE